MQSNLPQNNNNSVQPPQLSLTTPQAVASSNLQQKEFNILSLCRIGQETGKNSNLCFPNRRALHTNLSSRIVQKITQFHSY